MITRVVVWIATKTGASQILVQIVGAALILGGLALGFKFWLNRHDDKVYKDGQVSTANAVKDAAETQIAMERKKLEADKAANVAYGARVEADSQRNAAVQAQIGKDRAMMADLHRKNLADIQRKEDLSRAQLNNVRPSEWDDTLRRISNDPAIKPVN